MIVYFYMSNFNKLLHSIYSRSERINVSLFLSSTLTLWCASVRKPGCVRTFSLSPGQACHGLYLGIFVKDYFRFTFREAQALRELSMSFTWADSNVTLIWQIFSLVGEGWIMTSFKFATVAFSIMFSFFFAVFDKPQGKI